MPEAGMLEIEKLNVRYGGIHAVRDVSLKAIKRMYALVILGICKFNAVIGRQV